MDQVNRKSVGAASRDLDHVRRALLDALELLEAQVVATGGFSGAVRPRQRRLSYQIDVLEGVRQGAGAGSV